MPRRVEVAPLVAAARQGQPRAVARLISLVEDGQPAVREVMARLAPYTGHARVIAVTGSPGVGKSTTTNALVSAFRRRGCRIGVVAVDPSSPFSSGALLGDRIRMQDHVLDPEVYIRSMATRGHLGGLAATTPQAIRVLDGAGCDVVIVETVGVGQSEVEVAALADTTLVLVAPGMGDGIQAAKAGILEIADVFVVNKADRPGADATVTDLRHMISLGDRVAPGLWRPPVVRATAIDGGGIDEVLEGVDKHWAWLSDHGHLGRRRRDRAAREVEALALAALRTRMSGLPQGQALPDLADEVAGGRLDPYAAADRLVASLAPRQRADRPAPGEDLAQ